MGFLRSRLTSKQYGKSGFDTTLIWRLISAKNTISWGVGKSMTKLIASSGNSAECSYNLPMGSGLVVLDEIQHRPDLLKKQFVLHPGEHNFPMAEKIEAVGLMNLPKLKLAA